MFIDYKFMEYYKLKYLNYFSLNLNMSSLFLIISFL